MCIRDRTQSTWGWYQRRVHGEFNAQQYIIQLFLMIIYALVARGTLVLAEYTNYDGDFPQVARKLIAKTEKSRTKKTFLKDNYAFTFFSEDEFTFLCMTEKEYNRESGHKFLNKLANSFYSNYERDDAESGRPKSGGMSWSALFSKEIKKLMEESSIQKDEDKLKKVEEELNAVHEIAKENMDKILIRDTQLDKLVTKTSDLKAKVNSTLSNIQSQHMMFLR
eukprot:TRINITY_DN2308_c0_g3_i2.p1 TRINITY_DN2308_c0_g3~~TRINITY_DN2308_c0_g3_i2.p1  ORF type:complete len:238 (-),score=45.13 TRINITY_DN2308_c0_g3_i2:206-871(-)